MIILYYIILYYIILYYIILYYICCYKAVDLEISLKQSEHNIVIHYSMRRTYGWRLVDLSPEEFKMGEGGTAYEVLSRICTINFATSLQIITR